MKRKNYSGIPWWMIFLLTCFFSWGAVLSAGITVNNKKWIIRGVIYGVLFFLASVMINQDETQKIRNQIISNIRTGKKLSVIDSVKFSKAIKITIEIKEKTTEIKQIKKQKQDSAIRNIIRAKKKEIKDLEQLRYKSVREATSELKTPMYVNLFMILWIISGFVATVDAFVIRREYWIRLEKKEKILISGIEPVKQEKPKVQLSENQKIIKHVEQLRKEILKIIKKTKKSDALAVEDIEELVDNYSKQISKLIEEEEFLKSQNYSAKMQNIADEIDDLKKKMSQSVNVILTDEYKITIETKEKLLLSFKKEQEVHQAIRLRIKTAVTSLRQVRQDLLALNDVLSGDDKDKFFKDFQDKSTDLSDYLKILKDTIEEFK